MHDSANFGPTAERVRVHGIEKSWIKDTVMQQKKYLFSQKINIREIQKKYFFALKF